MAMLKKIGIKGYRSIKEMSLELRPLNVLIGANGSGKSNFISFFKLLNEMMSGRLQQYIGTTGRAQSVLHFGPKVTPELETRLEFDTGIYRTRLVLAAGDTLVIAEETAQDLVSLGTPWSRTSSASGDKESTFRIDEEPFDIKPISIKQLLDQCRVYHFHDTSREARVRRFAYVNDNSRLSPDAGNMAAMLYAYRQRSPVVYQRIVSTVRKILPEFDDFDLEPSRLNANEIILNWRKRGFDYLFGPHQLSDGSLRAMAICTLLLQPENDLPDLIILDEPELGLHPHALELIAGLMRGVASKKQLIVATQSRTFLDFFDPSEIITVDCHDGRSRFHRLEPDELKDWLEDYTVGELWQRNVIGGGPLP